MKKDPKQPKEKPVKTVMPIYCTLDFREAVQKRVKAEGRDVSKLVRMLLRERYRDLPED